MLFNDFNHRYILGKKVISNIKKQQVLPSLGLNDIGI